ncbi:cupin domain-containing protein [Aquipuribacter sp. SD81]|uniref:cupin domain-containing protein n=1 Tax=Aquipuribacter sp. SD81 TaxID=3127703 RepID=UPI00301A1E9F
MSWPDPLHRPYPRAVHTGADGEVSAWLRRDGAPPDVTYPSGGTCEYLATGDRTRGRFGLYRWTFGEAETGPEPHFHRSISEQFYVLSGEVRLFDGRDWLTAGVGDFLYVPEGGVHAFRGSGGASMLLVFAPGGPREDYFETLARGAPTDPVERALFMARHDTYWV